MRIDFSNPAAPDSQTQMGQGVQVGTSGGVFSRVINYGVVALAVLLPLFFLPLTYELREFNKQSLLIFAVLVMSAAWVIRILTLRKVQWRKTSLDYVILAYGFIYLLSTLFSVDKASSFLGYYGRFSGSFLTVFALILLYFVVVNNVRSKRAVQAIYNALTISSGLVLLLSFLQILGVDVFGATTSNNSFNTIGSMVAMSIFAAVSVIFYQWQMFVDDQARGIRQIALVILTVLALAVMFLINAFSGWLILTLGLIVFLSVATVLKNREAGLTWFWKPMTVLVIALLFVAFQVLPSTVNPRRLVSPNLPIEIQLSNSATFELIKNSLTNGAKTAAIGSGPGTTGIVYGEIKPESINKTVVWSLNFDRASTEAANILIETGLLGFLAFEAASLLFLIYGMYFLVKQNHPAKMQAYGFYMIFATLYIAHWFYFFNTTFYFIYWLSIAMFMAMVHWSDTGEEQQDLSMSASPRAALSWMFASLILLAVILVGTFFQVTVYASDMYYARGLKQLSQPKPDFMAVEKSFGTAANLNPYRDVYYQAYAQNLLFLAASEAAKEKPDIAKINTWIKAAADSARAAANRSPEKASNWSVLAQVYNSLKPMGVSGTDAAAISAWDQAIQRDSKNPSLYVQLATSYTNASSVFDTSEASKGTDTDQDGIIDTTETTLGSNPQKGDTNDNGVIDGDELKNGFNPATSTVLTAQHRNLFTRTDTNMLKKAEEALDTAIKLKADLPDPYIALARLYERQNRVPDARRVLDDAASKFPFNSDILFEQGRVIFNQKDITRAEQIFNAVLKINENHANSMYSLGLIYLQKGDRAKALTTFERVREISGPNVELEKLINGLKTQ